MVAGLGEEMKIIGLIGGMSWESTVTYYQMINEIIKEKLGGFHSAKCILYSVDFHEIEECLTGGDWERGAEILTDAALRLEKGGAEFIIICTNTMHKVADQIQSKISIPILHIADVIAEELKENHIDKAALLGTKYTMEQDFYKDRLIENGIAVMIPEEQDRERINTIIFQELCLGIISEKSKKEYLRIIDDMMKQGARGIILGCTEIGLLINQEDTIAPLFDTTVIHGKRAAIYSIGN
ncbi:MAG TPA: aspartate/glutamate racemase family protein [Anaerovoracaceae bacterium]|nr:aspartate/glutamate racemase family protein [Anaerovoracaceae bacterium]